LHAAFGGKKEKKHFGRERLGDSSGNAQVAVTNRTPEMFQGESG